MVTLEAIVSQDTRILFPTVLVEFFGLVGRKRQTSNVGGGELGVFVYSVIINRCYYQIFVFRKYS